MEVAEKISNKITEVVTEVKVVHESMDDILDKIIWFQKRFDKMSDKLRKVTDCITSYTALEDNPKELQPVILQMRFLVKLSVIMMTPLINSKYYGGYKPQLDRFRDEVEVLKEQVNDLQIRLTPIEEGSSAHEILVRLNNR